TSARPGCATTRSEWPGGVRGARNYIRGRPPLRGRCASALHQLKQVLEFPAHLLDHLRGQAGLDLAGLALQALAGAGNGVALFVQERANLPDHQHVMALVVAPVAAPLDRLEAGEFRLPVAQHVRLDVAQLADFTDGEVALGRDRRELAVTAWIQHRLPPAPSASGLDGRSPPCGRRSESPRRSWGCAPAAGSCGAGRSCRSPTARPAA